MLKPISALLLAATLTTPAMADDFSDKIKQALKSELRSEKEKERDRNRKPVQTLEFFGIKDDMKVMELIPGRGWYTKLLAPALRDNGQLYLALGTSRIEKSLESEKALNKVKVLAKDSEFKYNENEELYDLTSTDLKVKDLDAVLTFRNYHNLTLKTRTQLNDSVFKALKPGGIYGVVDHTRRHMQGTDNENGRRFDPVLAIKEIQAAGFEFVDYSTLHYRPDDELRYEVGRKSVTGNTDRFTFLFKKPE
ncbi:methyltransferase [Thalassomonas sp. RHCl1]|uniref:class I SAM-dependent methyltransferase n=1 Tax=Thalassomonas sp. RHCl1 TaxID=2995320 RepID=UPI00248BE273|nr:methyltransferase [Thalassomonas sp. RHCl1]